MKTFAETGPFHLDGHILMRSTAQIQGHPLHPILIAVLFGFGAPVFSLVGILAD